MKKYILFGLILAVAVSAWAVTKHESRQTEAQSMVLYGSNGTVILPLLLDDAGKLVANFSAMNFTQNATGLYWNLSNDTSVSKTAASLVTRWMNGTSNNASTVISVMSAGSLTERMNFTGTNQIILLNTTTIMPSADGTSSFALGNSSGSKYFFGDSTNKRIGIGIIPSSLLDVQGAITTQLSLTNNASSSSTAGAFITLMSNDGAANAAGDRLGAISFNGQNGTANAVGARFFGFANSTWSATNNDAYLSFSTVPTGSQTIVERVRIDPAGNVGIGTTAPTGKLSIIGGPAYNQALCLNATGAMSNCSSVVGATGGCTCP
jgi:hypothetical protein